MAWTAALAIGGSSPSSQQPRALGQHRAQRTMRGLAWLRSRAKPVGIRTAAAEQATAGINRPGPLSVGERRLRRDLVLRDDGFGPREIFQQALAGQDKEVIAELRVLEVDLEQLFAAERWYAPGA